MAQAKSFRELVALIEQADKLLLTHGKITDPAERLIMLRGLYYGATWSVDFKKESNGNPKKQVKDNSSGAFVRILGYLNYSHHILLLRDPRPHLGDSLTENLQDSQNIVDGGRTVDIGHVLFGMELRGQDSGGEMIVPGTQATRLEAISWVGDLGGGSAALARDRLNDRNASVKRVFENDAEGYGLPDNLEGDIGAYLVGCGKTPGGPVEWLTYGNLSNMLRDYLPFGRTNEWESRAARFLSCLGGQVKGTKIVNPQTVVDLMAEKFYNFAALYAATRWGRNGALYGKDADLLCRYLRGATQEVAEVFVKTLADSLIHPRLQIKAAAPYPKPRPPEPKCGNIWLQAAAHEPTQVFIMLKILDREINAAIKGAGDLMKAVESSMETVDSLP